MRRLWSVAGWLSVSSYLSNAALQDWHSAPAGTCHALFWLIFCFNISYMTGSFLSTVFAFAIYHSTAFFVSLKHIDS